MPPTISDRSLFADVILPVPLHSAFTYSIPKGMESRIERGFRVRVPFGQKRSCVGIVAKIHSTKPEGFDVKEIEDLLGDEPTVTPIQLDLWDWISEYYMAPIGDVFSAAVPSGIRTEHAFKPKTEQYLRLTQKFRSEDGIEIAKEILGRKPAQKEVFSTFLRLLPEYSDKGLEGGVAKDVVRNEANCSVSAINSIIKGGILETFSVEIGRLNTEGEPHPENIKSLNQAQTEALGEILNSMETKDVTLLHGVTSSGKTEIYINLIQKEIDKGNQVMFLLPEIALTVQIMERLRQVFGARLGIYHSRYSEVERAEIWQKQMSDSPYDIILGARSAVFLPMKRLGLVIVDEEHEGSFKQQDPAPRYNARSVAIMLAKMSGAKTLLGTATPCMESYYNSKNGKYGYVALNQRYKGISLPEFRIVDVARLRFTKVMDNGPLSPMLIDLINDALARGRQAILFQNRRGYAPMMVCPSCGWTPKCANCDVTLTVHRSLNTLSCHYCGLTYSIPQKCPDCGEENMRVQGWGTEKIEDIVRGLFPKAKVVRMDLDTTRSKDAYQKIISDFSDSRTDILIGTQMVSKGLDFANVSVVGILNADQMLRVPDFRAYEHAFQMMAQVGGRAGRKGERGVVVVQTNNPKQDVLQLVKDNDYAQMFSHETVLRQTFKYPPFCRLIYIYLKHRNEMTTETASERMANMLRSWMGDRILGPGKPVVSRVKTLFIRIIMVKLEPGIDLRDTKSRLLDARNQLNSERSFSTVSVYFDVDPE